MYVYVQHKIMISLYETVYDSATYRHIKQFEMLQHGTA